MEATRAVRKGEAVVMDYGPEKLDNALLLDHGVLDASSAKVGGWKLEKQEWKLEKQEWKNE